MTTQNKIEIWRRHKADAPLTRNSIFSARSPLQAQHERTIAYQAALDILG